MELLRGLVYNTVIILYIINAHTTPCSAQRCSEPTDLTVVIDCSSDVTISNFYDIRQFLIRLVELNLQISFSNVRVNFLQYSSVIVPSGNYLTSGRRARTVLEDMRYLSGDGERPTSDALDYYLNRPASNDRSDTPNVVVLVITGPSENKTRAIETADTVERMGHDVMVVSVTHCTDLDEIEQLTSAPRVEGQNYFLFDTYSDLDSADAAAAVADGLCNRHVPAEENATNSANSTLAPRICILPTTTASPTSTGTLTTGSKRPDTKSGGDSEPQSGGGLSSSQKAAIGVMVPLIILLTVGGVAIFYYFRTKK